MNEVITHWELKIDRKIEVIDLNIGNYKLYKDTWTINNGEDTKEYQGVTEKLCVKGLSKIENDNNIYLVTKDFIERYRKGDMWDKTELIANNMYDIYKENFEKYLFVRKLGYDMTYLDGRLVPQIVCFGRFCGLITSYMYNLEGLEVYLKSHPEKFLSIRKIQWPEYAGYIKELSFCWLPDEEEYNIFIKSINEVARTELKKYLGIEKFRIK